MSYIRIDVRLPRHLEEEFIQALRDVEQRYPDQINMNVIAHCDDPTSMLESVQILDKLSPELPWYSMLERKDMTPRQRRAHDKILKMAKENK